MTTVEHFSYQGAPVRTVRELGDIAAARNVTAASLLGESGPQPAPSRRED